jgi:flagellar hook-basal body complex protein FliE
MSGVDAIAALSASGGSAIQALGSARADALPERPMEGAFGPLLVQGIAAVDAKVANADALVAQFAIDDSIPVHQVTFALEEARLSVEFAMQVRARLVEGYKELMNMQL